MTPGAAGIITIKGMALTTMVPKAWALRKFGQSSLGDGFAVEVKKCATPAAGDDDSDSEGHRAEAAAADADAPDSDSDVYKDKRYRARRSSSCSSGSASSSS